MERRVDWATKPEPVGGTRWRFPSPAEMPESDLVTVGGDLEPSTLIHAYRRGIFPMEVTGMPGVIGWWSPDPRGIVPLDGLRVTKSMRQSARRFDIRVDTRNGRTLTTRHPIGPPLTSALAGRPLELWQQPARGFPRQACQRCG